MLGGITTTHDGPACSPDYSRLDAESCAHLHTHTHLVGALCGAGTFTELHTLGSLKQSHVGGTGLGAGRDPDLDAWDG